MNKDGFLRFLQQLLTMIDQNRTTSVVCAKRALEDVCALARDSGKSDGMTVRMMMEALCQFDRLVMHKDSFSGVPGDYQGNAAKRHHLEMMLYPHC